MEQVVDAGCETGESANLLLDVEEAQDSVADALHDLTRLHIVRDDLRARERAHAALIPHKRDQQNEHTYTMPRLDRGTKMVEI